MKVSSEHYVVDESVLIVEVEDDPLVGLLDLDIYQGIRLTRKMNYDRDFLLYVYPSPTLTIRLELVS